MVKAQYDAATEGRGSGRWRGRVTTIVSLATYVPPKLVTNADLEKMVDTTDDWIRERTGIRERYVVNRGVATSDLVKETALRAIERAGFSPDDLGFIVEQRRVDRR